MAQTFVLSAYMHGCHMVLHSSALHCTSVQLLNFKLQNIFILEFLCTALHCNSEDKLRMQESARRTCCARNEGTPMPIMGNAVLGKLQLGSDFGHGCCNWLSYLKDAANTVRNLLARPACSFPRCQTHPLIPPVFLIFFPPYNTRKLGQASNYWNAGPEY